MTATTFPQPATVQDELPDQSSAWRPLRAKQSALSAEDWSQLQLSSGPRRFRLQRESEVPRLMASMEPEGSSSAAPSGQHDSQRPDQLAGERQERRQIVAIARMVCQATTEVLNGLRPVNQLRRWLDAEVHRKVEQRAAIMARHRSPSTARPHRLSFDAEQTTHPRAGAWEVSVIFTDEHRTRACALRLQAHRGRWRVVAMELG
ncbi:Rv3235 family protein [Nesterenkonia muleiensis]|uniref:Rv3235 family protein n=1 Tax=Nesterenkonia muleiensis TaxID=2282648 RepID=UPI000E70D547|nr:Rv3235 family protein [Nesterenkonia muleiensis]